MENIEIDELEEGGHICPYCGMENFQINDHFNHIELFHPEKPLI
jgi:hypothetical protein